MAKDSNAAARASEVKPAAEGPDAEPETAQSFEAGKAELAAPDADKADGAEKLEAGDNHDVARPVPTLRQIFELPDKDTDPADDRWQAFQEKVVKEVKGIKWMATVPDLAPKVGELLDIKIPNVLIVAWKKIKDIQEVIEKSKKTPDETIYLELAQHTINSEHKPSINVKIKGATVKKIELVIQLGFNLKGFLLKVQNGAITEMQTGQCEAKGTIKYGGLTVAEKKLEPIKLPFSIPIPPELFLPIDKAEADKVEELERIEL